MKIHILLVATLFLLTGTLAHADVCHGSPQDIANDQRMRHIHGFVRFQEYIGNMGRRLENRSAHDTYFNWEHSNGQTIFRIYNVTFNQAFEGIGSLCRGRDGYYLGFSNNVKIPIYLLKYDQVGIKYGELKFVLGPMSLESHGSLRNKMRYANFPIPVRTP